MRFPLLATTLALTVLTATVLACEPPWTAPKAQPASEPAQVKAPDQEPGGWTTAVDPKPLTENIHRGLAWLVAQQHDDGGWGQGEESRNMGAGMAHMQAKPNVADTCIATLALIRSGSSPS